MVETTAFSLVHAVNFVHVMALDKSARQVAVEVGQDWGDKSYHKFGEQAIGYILNGIR